jgi:hypothetical protein
MAIDEYAKEQEPARDNVRPFRRAALPAPKSEHHPGPLTRHRNIVDDDDDPGPSAA